MKTITVGLVIMAAILLVLGVPGQGAAQYLGQTTWTVTKTLNKHGAVDPPEIFTITGGISHVGGAYYTMQGYVAVPDDGPAIISGGGVLIGNTIYMTLSLSQQHVDTNRDASVLHLELDKDTLSGTFYDVHNDFDTATIGETPVFHPGFSSGTVTLSGPPISLGSGVSGAVSLLLLN